MPESGLMITSWRHTNRYGLSVSYARQMGELTLQTKVPLYWLPKWAWITDSSTLMVQRCKRLQMPSDFGFPAHRGDDRLGQVADVEPVPMNDSTASDPDRCKTARVVIRPGNNYQIAPFPTVSAQSTMRRKVLPCAFPST